MKRKVFAIAMSVALIVALVPLFGGAALAVSGGTGVTTEVPDVAGLAVAPGTINFGTVPPGESSQVAEALRTITLDNTGNCNLDVSTEIIGEERVVEGELLGHGDGLVMTWGPTDYTPIVAASETVRLAGVAQGGGSGGGIYTMDYDAGTVTFDVAPAGGVLVSIDYASTSIFYSGPEAADPYGPFNSLYQGMTLNDASAPPEILAREYARVLVDDQSCDPLAQIYVREDYPVKVETAQIIFWAEYKLPVDNPPTVEFQLPTPSEVVMSGDPVLIQTRNIDDWGVLSEVFSVVQVGVGEVASGALSLVSGNALDGIWEATWNTTGAPATLTGVEYEITVTAEDAKAQTGDDSVTVVLKCTDPQPVVTSISTDPVSPVDNLVRITATATDEPDVGVGGGLVSGEYRIDGAGDWTAMDPDVALPANAVTFTADWDCTAVADGDHTINVRVTDTTAQPTTDSLAIKVNNQGPVAWTYQVTYVDEQLLTTRQVVNELLGTGNGTQTVFGPTASVPIDAESELVYVAPSLDPKVRDVDYTINYVTGVVTFTTAPPSGKKVTIDYNWVGSHTNTQVSTWILAVETVEVVTTPYFGPGPCAKINTDYGTPAAIRFRDGTRIAMFSSSAWVDVMTGQTVKAEAAINLFGFVVTTYITYEWVDEDTYINHMVLDPPLSPPTNDTFDVVMTGVELTSVPAGEFMCAVMEHSVVASDAVPPTPLGLSNTEYLDIATPSTGLIKALDASWDGDSTQVLVSVYDPGA